MFRFLLPVAAIGTLLAMAQQTPAPPRMDVAARGHAVIHILTANDDGEAVGEPVTPALVAFRVEEGKIDGAGVIECEQDQETRQAEGSTVTYPVVVLNCGAGVKLAVVGLDLTVKK